MNYRRFIFTSPMLHHVESIRKNYSKNLKMNKIDISRYRYCKISHHISHEFWGINFFRIKSLFIVKFILTDFWIIFYLFCVGMKPNQKFRNCYGDVYQCSKRREREFLFSGDENIRSIIQKFTISMAMDKTSLVCNGLWLRIWQTYQSCCESCVKGLINLI